MAKIELSENIGWVDFRRQEPEPFESLLWGITGSRAHFNQIASSQSVVSQEPVGDKQPQSVQPRQTVQNSRYQKLEKLLKVQMWEEADKETHRLMITRVGKKVGKVFERKELLNFPCDELRAIDSLWVRYSEGRFGFSVQKKIYVQCGGKLDGKDPSTEVWRELGDRVGWRKKGKWIYIYDDIITNSSLFSPEGIFPVRVFVDDLDELWVGWFVGWLVWQVWGSLLSHTDL